MSYKGKISTSGTSDAIRLDKNLFKQHPEFKQKAEVRASVIGRGTMLISLVDNPDQENPDDPILTAFLSFVEKDLAENPKAITPVSVSNVARAKKLTAKVKVTDDELE